MRYDVEKAVQLLLRGDTNSVEEALELLQKSVFSFSMRVCGQQQDAEDTMQEVLIKSLPHLPQFTSSKALAVWLYKVARNCCLMSRRKSRFAPNVVLSLEELMPDRDDLERLDGGVAVSPESAAIRGEQDQRVRDAVRSLPPHYRIVIVLRDMEGLTEDEVAEITGLRSGTVRVRLHRARLFVRKELAKLNRHPKSRGSSGEQAAPVRRSRCKRIFSGLSDYLDGQLDDFSCEEMETHLNGCVPCKEFLRSLEATITSCRNTSAEYPDPDKAAALRRQLLGAYCRALAKAGK
jgi:RNA polymerase sigma-70 factor (ECF subfamily)